ncbi:MAG: FtsX-like permease family protein [candidate division KSB1 bacterium]|jgi:ABC-type lipoprotein release transport system permease subunit|nr:FtsX-like permease family protein [candidate division KSB1 bacterium]
MLWTYVKLAWRNLFRNKRRSLIAGIAIGLGLASLIFVDAMIIGMRDNMIASATSSFLGEGQIHQKDFRTTQSVENTIQNKDWVVSNLEEEKIVEHFTRRVMNMAMINSAANMSSISLVGIDPETEKPLSQVDDAITKGAFFEENRERDILIGSKLAEILEVDMGDRVVVTVSQAETGDLSQEMFLVSGIYHFNMKEMDRGMAFVRLRKAQDMFNIGDEIHEIAINFTSTKYGREGHLPFWDKYSKYSNEALGWTKLMPQLKAALDLSSFSTYLTGLILFGVVSLGIINTLFMSLYERMFEFGVLRAVGTRPFGIARLILLEAGALAILSIILGNIIGFVITYTVSKVGIDYTGIEFAGVTFRELLYPVLEVSQFIYYPLWVFVLTVVVGIYPAVYAAKISPADAMRKVL